MRWFKKIYNRFQSGYSFRTRISAHPKIITISDDELKYSSWPDLDGFQSEKEALDYIVKYKKREQEVLIYELKRCVKIKVKAEVSLCEETK